MFALQGSDGYLIGWFRTTQGFHPVFDRSKRQAEVYRTRRAANEGLADAQQRLAQKLQVVKV